MDNNLTKNRFFYRSIQFDLILHQISIKKVIIKALQKGIKAGFTAQKKERLAAKLNQILTSLVDKVVLQHTLNSSSLVYCCPIAFPLANLWSLPSLQVAQELVSGLEIKNQELAVSPKLQFAVKISNNGLMEFTFCDRSIGWWLESVLRRLGEMGELREHGEMGKMGEMGDYNLFPLQYIDYRCSSLLRLGKQEGLINLENSVYAQDIWQITNPNPFKYYCDENIGYCYELAELNLLCQLLLVIDYLQERNEQYSPTLAKLTLNLSNACSTFLADCRIFGSVAHHNRDLAIARLGLIAIVQLCLQKTLLYFNSTHKYYFL